MRVTLTLASIGMVALAACAAPSSTAPERGLVGADVASLREALGPPVQLSAGAGVLRLSYRNQTGEVVEDAVIVIDGTVAKAAEGLVANRGDDLPERLTLAPIQEAIETLGPVHDVAVGTSSAQVRFADWDATVVEGLVVGLRKS